MKKIAITREGVTGILSGLDITGDLLDLEANGGGPMAVNQITGPVAVGGALRHALTVESTVSQPISIGDGGVGDGLAAEVTAEFQGNEAEFSEQQTPSDVSVAPLRTPFSQKGPEEEEEEYDWGPSSHQRSFIERLAGALHRQ